MSLREFLDKLWLQGLELWTEGEHLRFRGSSELMSRHLDKLRENKSEILAILAEDSQSYTGFPLSHGQRLIKLLHDICPHSSVNNLVAIAKIRPSTDWDALQQAVHVIVHRHEALRSYITQRETLPIQRIKNVEEVLINYREVIGWSQQQVVESLCVKADEPFSLTDGPLVRVMCLQNCVQGFDYCYFMLCVHHMVADLCSMEILISEINRAYNYIVAGKQPTLAKLHLTYKDFVKAEDHKFHSYEDKSYEDKKGKVNEQKQLEHEMLSMGFAGDNNERQAEPLFHGASYEFELPAALTNTVYTLIESKDITPFNILMSAFQVLLCHYSGQQDIVITIPIDCRERTKLKKVVGCFTNFEVVEERIVQDMSFVELLARNKKKERYAQVCYEDFLQALCDKIMPVKDRSCSSVLRVAMSWHKLDDSTWLEGGADNLFQEILSIGQIRSPYDIALNVVEGKNALKGSLHYQTNIYDENIIAQMYRYFEMLLSMATASLEQSMDNITVKQLREKCWGEMFSDKVLAAEKNSGSIAPRTPLEHRLAIIWQNLFKLDQIGVYDDFFELGGHTVLITQLHSQLKSALAVELPIHLLFKATTIASLAEVITSMACNNQSSERGEVDAFEQGLL